MQASTKVKLFEHTVVIVHYYFLEYTQTGMWRTSVSDIGQDSGRAVPLHCRKSKV